MNKYIKQAIAQQGALLNPIEPPEGAILTEDGLNYLITEDEQFYLQYETEED